LGLLIGYLATSSAKYDVILLLGNPHFPVQLMKFHAYLA